MDWKEIEKKAKEVLKFLKYEYRGRFIGDKKTWADYPGVGKITDYDVWQHVKKHTRWFDRLNPRFITHCALQSQNHLFGVYAEEDKLYHKDDPNWKYPE